MQLAICLPNLLFVEYQPAMHRLANRFLIDPIVCENGELHVSEQHGLGITLNEEAITPFVTQTTRMGQT